ncbi:HNH endonuclease signature motif containing protein [Pseudomonas palleroniana]
MTVQETFAKKTRKPFSKKIENILLYKSARTCCVCRVPKRPVEIHHIDEDPSNNNEENLVVICANCHDEAHTIHKLSKNLTPERLRDTKKKWEDEVSKRASHAMTSQANLNQAVWTYINHQRLPQIMKAHGIKFDETLHSILIATGVTDKIGIPILKKKKESRFLTTIYDRLEYDEAHRLHHMYCEAIDDLIEASNPIELGAIWSKTEIKDLIAPGTICFCMRGFRFQRGDTIENEEDRVIYAKAKNIEIRFSANTRHMFGSSALYDSFVGHRFIAALIIVKNVDTEDGVLVIRATPLAMGAGFVTSAYDTPYAMKTNRLKR